MYAVILGVLLLAAKMAEIGPTASWPWWVVLAPFGIALLWWEFADGTGWTKRRAMDKLEARKDQRREKALEALGLGTRRQRKRGEFKDEALRKQAKADALEEKGPVSRPSSATDRRDPR